MSDPRATVRLQFHAGFTLEHARAQVPYFASLGISHVYASPLLGSRRGSTHGYDGVRPDIIDAELGGEPALRRLVGMLRAHGMGLVMDLVPNHMSASLENPWWFDVLEHGRDSVFSHYFDIDWDGGNGRVLLPWLTGTLDACVADGDAALRWDPAAGRLFLHAGPARVPLGARHYGEALADLGAELQPLRDAFSRADGPAAFEAARAQLAAAATGSGRAALEAALESWLPVDDARRERLRALFSVQPWQLADWQAAPRRINWRRFFDIGALAALRVEQADVFDAVHAYPLSLYAEGLLDGLRIDHVDGLLDPAGYCRRLRAELQARMPMRPAGLRQRPWLLVEKILAAGEPLRRDWGIDGSTGYDFMEQVGALLHDPAGEPALSRTWTSVAAETAGSGVGAARFALAQFDAAARAARREILQKGFAADLTRALRALGPLVDTAADDPLLREAVAALIEHFPVYRTYLAGDAAADDCDSSVLRNATEAACVQASPAVQALLRALLARLSELPEDADAGERRRCALPALQQLTPPIAAKAIEDTTFYRFGRLLSRNEVGAEPGQLSLSADEFHRLCEARARDWPRALLATATHDHKRGEDARARLAVLAADADWWQDCQAGWRERHAGWRTRGTATVPDAVDEAILYQTLLASWPPTLSPDDADGVAALRERVGAWQQKALREAKRHSSWAAPDVGYEAACREFLHALLDDPGFRLQLHAAVQRVGPAGALNGLVQCVLRNTVPGVPDLYQGTEWWDHSLVDPDNRRPVDFAARAAALADDAAGTDLRRHWRDGRIKQRLLARILRLRAAHPALFAAGDYRPLGVTGAGAAHALAFLRSAACAGASTHALVVVPLHAAAAGGWAPDAGLGLDRGWLQATFVELPAAVARLPVQDALSGRSFDLHDGRVAFDRVLHDWPVAVWLFGASVGIDAVANR